MQLPTTPLDAHLFHLIGGVAQAGSVDKAEKHAAQHERILNHIARGAVHVAHNRTVVLQKRVEQRRLPGIRRTDDGHRPTFAQGIARRERIGQTSRLGFHRGCDAIQLTAVGKLQIFVIGEIQFQLK